MVWIIYPGKEAILLGDPLHRTQRPSGTIILLGRRRFEATVCKISTGNLLRLVRMVQRRALDVPHLLCRSITAEQGQDLRRALCVRLVPLHRTWQPDRRTFGQIRLHPLYTRCSLHAPVLSTKRPKVKASVPPRHFLTYTLTNRPMEPLGGLRTTAFWSLTRSKRCLERHPPQTL